MKKIITKKEKGCYGCLFDHRNCGCCDTALKATGINCIKEGVIFVHEEESEE